MASAIMTVSEQGSVSGITPGMNLHEASIPIGLGTFTTRPFEAGTDKVFRYIDRGAGIELVTDSSDRILQVMCFPPSKLQLPSGQAVFELQRSKLFKWLEHGGRTVVPDAEGFFHTDPECFGGRYYKRELIVFTSSVPNVTKIVLALLSD